MKFTSGLSSSGAVKATHRAVTPGARSCRRPRRPVASVDKQSPQPEYVCIEACGALQIVGVQRGFKDAVELGHRFEPPLGFRFCSGFSSEGARPGRCTGDSARFSGARSARSRLRSSRGRATARGELGAQKMAGEVAPSPATAARQAISAGVRSETVGPRCPWRSIRRNTRPSPIAAAASQRRSSPHRTAPFFRAERNRHGRAGALAISLRAPDSQHDPLGLEGRSATSSATSSLRAQPAKRRSREHSRHTEMTERRDIIRFAGTPPGRKERGLSPDLPPAWIQGQRIVGTPSAKTLAPWLNR
jgi:hypothetical protein